MQENEKNTSVIRELRKNCSELETELEKSNQMNVKLNDSRNELKLELDQMKQNYVRNVDTQVAKMSINDEKINELELELAKITSKLDESYLQLNDTKKNYLNQLKQVSL